MVPENIHTNPAEGTEGIGFSTGEWGGGGSICLFSSGEEGTKGKYFQTVLVMRKRVTKKKTQKFTTKIYLRRIRINEHSKDILSVPWNDLSRENVPYGLPFVTSQGKTYTNGFPLNG